MKKIIIAAAVAATFAPAISMADATVYGNFRGSIIDTDNAAGESSTQFVNNASRLGFKGEYGEEGGLTGFFNLQLGAANDSTGASDSGLTSRFFFAGVKGDFGKVMVGRFSSPYKMAGLKTDPFYDTSAGVLNSGSNHGYSSLTNGWLNNGVAYISPKYMGAFTVNAAMFLDDEDNASNTNLAPANTENPLNLGVTYSANGITASVQHFMDSDGVDGDTIRYTAAYKIGAIGVAASYEDWDTDAEFLAVSATYQMSDDTKLAVAYGNVEDSKDTTASRELDGTSYTIGAFHKIAPKTTLTLIYSDVDGDAGVNDRETLALGIIQSF